MRIAILGYSNTVLGTWDPDNVNTGLAGSEEAVVYASMELAKLDHNVTVYMDPPSGSNWSLPNSNPRWLPWGTWFLEGDDEKYDLVLMWRRQDIVGKLRGKKVFHWSHDSPWYSDSHPPFGPFDGVCVLTEYHRKQLSVFSGFDKVPYTISGNGIVPEHFDEIVQKDPYSLGYFSNYSRGLETLIDIWPEIKERFPKATLSICYGRQTWGTLSEDRMKTLVSKIEKYSSLGVTEHGMIGHVALATLMKRLSILAYPCNCEAETFCITVVKAQAAGMIPVTTRVGALNETVHPNAPTVPNLERTEDYKNLLLNTLARVEDTNKIEKERQQYRDYGNQYTWRAVVQKWLQLYNRV